MAQESIASMLLNATRKFKAIWEPFMHVPLTPWLLYSLSHSQENSPSRSLSSYSPSAIWSFLVLLLSSLFCRLPGFQLMLEQVKGYWIEVGILSIIIGYFVVEKTVSPMIRNSWQTGMSFSDGWAILVESPWPQYDPSVVAGLSPHNPLPIISRILVQLSDHCFHQKKCLLFFCCFPSIIIVALTINVIVDFHSFSDIVGILG